MERKHLNKVITFHVPKYESMAMITITNHKLYYDKYVVGIESFDVLKDCYIGSLQTGDIHDGTKVKLTESAIDYFAERT